MPARRWAVQLLRVHGIFLFLEGAFLNMQSFFCVVFVSTTAILHVFDSFGCIASFILPGSSESPLLNPKP